MIDYVLSMRCGGAMSVKICPKFDWKKFLLTATLLGPVSLLVFGSGGEPSPVEAEKSLESKISFPHGYRDTFTNYLSLDRLQNPDQVIRLFANDIAMRGRDEHGQLPNGSVLVGEVYKAKLDEQGEVIVSSLGRRIRDELVLIAIMERGEHLGQGYPEHLDNGYWEFEAFKTDGTLAGKDLNSCRACHAPLKETDHLFSFDHFPIMVSGN